ncbi:MAG: hypothetical protein R2729_24495 [Bryobacteraceae bacterium]
MQNPRRGRNLGLIFALSGVAACGVAFVAADDGSWIHAALMIFGISAAVFGGCAAVLQHLDLRARNQLARGEAIVARWRVDAERWNAFREFNASLGQQPGKLPNEATLRPHPPGDSVEIIVGKNAIQVDGGIHRLDIPEVEGATFVEGAMPYLAFVLFYPDPGENTTSIRTALRFPVAPGHEKAARGVAEHFAQGRHLSETFFHGAGDGSDPEDVSTCLQCGYETHHYVANCPRCGSGVRSRRWTRRFGAVIGVCGLGVTAATGAVMVNTVPMLLHPGRDVGGARFGGTAGQGVSALVLLGCVFLFGAGCVAYGMWSVATGKGTRMVRWGAIGLGAVGALAVAGFLVSAG